MRVLAAAVYDALELSAWIHKGIGAGRWWESDAIPMCIYAHAAWIGDEDSTTVRPVTTALWHAGIDIYVNDDAVSRINGRRNRLWSTRVGFRAWARELGVVRGV